MASAGDRTDGGSGPDVGDAEQWWSVRHIPALDGLRGIAVALVLVFHAGLVTGGYIGVDLFFVLSGFLITRLLLVEVDRSGRVDLRRFWLRRARRLLPALMLFLLVVAVYATWFADRMDLSIIWGDSLATVFYVANWRAIVAGSDYWSEFVLSPLEHTWSLSIEEQFYLVWPLVVAAVFARGRRRGAPARSGLDHTRLDLFMISCGTLTVAGMAAGVLAWSRGASASSIYFNTFTRIPAMLLGAALAAYGMRVWDHLWTGDRWDEADGEQWEGWDGGEGWDDSGTVSPDRSRWALEGLGLVAVGWLVYVVGWVDGQAESLYRGALALSSLAGVILVAVAAHPVRGPISRVMSTPILRWLGAISYGLYLYHWPVFVALDEERTGLDDLSLLSVRVGVSIVLAQVSFEFIEKPIRSQGFRATGRRLVVVMLATAALTVGLTRSEGQRDTIPAGGLDVLFLGDSVPMGLGNEFLRDRQGWDIVMHNGALPSCALPRVDGWVSADGKVNEFRTGCTGWEEKWSESVARVKPGAVVLLFGNPPTGTYVVDGVTITPCTRAFSDFYEGELNRAVDVLAAEGGEVWLATSPYVRFKPTEERDRSTDCVNESVVAVAEERSDEASLLDLASWVCPDDCVEELGGETLRADGLHYSSEASDDVLRWMWEQIAPGAAPDDSGG